MSRSGYSDDLDGTELNLSSPSASGSGRRQRSTVGARETGIVRDEGGDDIVDALNHQPALIAEIRRLRLLVMEAFDAASLAASTHIDYDPDAAHQAVREARAAVVAKLEARKLHPEFERLEQKFDPRGPTPPWFVGGGA